MTYFKRFHPIPPTRTITFDVFAIGLTKHHVVSLLEVDVTSSRQKIRELRRSGVRVSFNGWIIQAISKTIEEHPESAAFLYTKTKLITFDDVNISFLVEKELEGKKIPIPVVLEKTNEKSAQEITREIEDAASQVLTGNDIVLRRKTRAYEKIYYFLPGFLRRLIWRVALRNPEFAFEKMGNVAVTSVGMAGRINGWFIHKSVHPLSFGLGSVIKKPVVVDDEIKIREILNMTLLIDHDAIDGAPMARFVKTLIRNMETGIGL
jgi:pyruvate/2-oxoglutarate dehydrogenase complex dihydrolipoamide acyltransferase (E2) component